METKLLQERLYRRARETRIMATLRSSILTGKGQVPQSVTQVEQERKLERLGKANQSRTNGWVKMEGTAR